MKKKLIPAIASIYQWVSIFTIGFLIFWGSPKIAATIFLSLLIIAALIVHRLWLVTCRAFISQKLLERYHLYPGLSWSNKDEHNLTFYSNFTTETYRISQELRSKYPNADEDQILNACYSVFMGKDADYQVHFKIRLNRAIDLLQGLQDYLGTKTFCSYWTYKRIFSDKYLIKVGG